MPLLKTLNNEDWWSTFSGLFVFAFIALVLLAIPESVTSNDIDLEKWMIPTVWDSDPLLFFRSYYVAALVPLFLVFLFLSTFVSAKSMKKKPNMLGVVFTFSLALVSIVLGNQRDLKVRYKGGNNSLYNLI